MIKNEGGVPLNMIFEVTKKGNPVYKTSFQLNSGWNEYYIPNEELCANVDMAKGGTIRAYLEDNQVGPLTFRFFDLVRFEKESALTPKPAAKVKCVAWDLDNTLWDGVIGDVGSENVSVRPDSVALIKALDERGILQTIVSKNTYCTC